MQWAGNWLDEEAHGRFKVQTARNVPKEVQEELPQLPWYELEIIAKTMSDDYAVLNIAFVWDLVHNDVPRWSQVLEVLLPDQGFGAIK